ncbi:uncharacterized protein TrAtP1_000921 [Trichoderma atroviride]|uniref:uncharacterized protein n=1 Tax=Hypocrea atroviridis TaxID=63577 RepID=UPI003326C28A|nr:hypothetical protein TrAtP1_000921 [Trichoderma atroviride]
MDQGKVLRSCGGELCVGKPSVVSAQDGCPGDPMPVATAVDATRAPGQVTPNCRRPRLWCAGAEGLGEQAPMPPSERPAQQPARLSTVLYPRTVPHDRELQRDGGDEQSGVTDEPGRSSLGRRSGGVQAKHQHRAVSGRKQRGAGFACATTADEALSGGPL